MSAAGLQESTSHRRGEGEQGEGEQGEGEGEGEGVQPLQWSFLTAGEGLRAVSSLNSPSQGTRDPFRTMGFSLQPSEETLDVLLSFSVKNTLRR